MNDHLHRLVARHAVPARLRPRSVSRFEDGLDGAPVTLQDETTVAARPATARPAAALGAEEAPAGTPVTPSPPASGRAIAGVRAGRTHAVSDPRPAQAGVRSASGAATAQPASVDQAGDERSTPAPPATTHHRLRAIAAPAIERPGRRASVTSRLPAWPAIVLRRSIAPIEREPDVVHVQIGRVEVRAVVAGDAPKPRAPAPAGPAPLSLGDYLGGERRA